MVFEGDPDAPDAELRPLVQQVEDRIAELIAGGREQRRGLFGIPAVDSLIPGDWL